ncbi:hypothetical protein J4420_02335 [Candidatus Woesearchaeota archaeon]|nr:hypothetical protein [Candidatus Woesearchaeota archaeon]
MTITTIEVSEDIAPAIEQIVHDFGFSGREEFFEEAIRDKVLELQKKSFITGSNKIADKLRKKSITEENILKDFGKRKY